MAPTWPPHDRYGMTEEALDGPVEIPESDEALLAECRVETFRSGGPGGQHQNTTESGVRVVHLPTGIRAVSREQRSQHRNRAIALQRLRERLNERNQTPRPRVETQIPKREQERRLESKRHRSRTKRLRRPPEPDHE